MGQRPMERSATVFRGARFELLYAALAVLSHGKALTACPENTDVLLPIERTFGTFSDAIGPRLRGCVCLRQASPRLMLRYRFLVILFGFRCLSAPRRFARGVTGQSFP